MQQTVPDRRAGHALPPSALFLLAVLSLGLGACDPDPLGIDGEEPNDSTAPATLAVTGSATVSDRYTAEIAARGDWAYTTTWGNRGGAAGNAVKIWNVSGAPALSDSLIVEGASTLGDVQISDDGALLVVATERQGGSIVLYDRADPAAPVRITRFSTPNTSPTGVHTLKLGRIAGRHYAFLSVNPGGTAELPARLVVIDITDPATPVEVLAMPVGLIHDVFVRDGILFTALWDDGLTIWDVGGGGRGGSPSAPVQIGNVRTVGGNVHNAWWYHAADGAKRYVLVGEEQAGGALGVVSGGDIHVVDVSDMTDPREVAFYTVPGAGAHNFVMDEAAGILYAAYYNGGVRALDVTGDLSDCAPTQRSRDGRCDLAKMGRAVGVGLQDRGPVSIWGVAKVGDTVYASDMLNGIWALDVAPLSPGAGGAR